MKRYPANSYSMLNRAVVLITLNVIAFGSQAADSEDLAVARTIVSRAPLSLPQFHEISERPLINQYTNETDYTRALGDSRYTFERVTYLSDGLEVIAFLYRRLDRTGPQPTIVFNRGSYVRNDSAPEYFSTFHRLAESGYQVLAPMYRGSEGGE